MEPCDPLPHPTLKEFHFVIIPVVIIPVVIVPVFVVLPIFAVVGPALVVIVIRIGLPRSDMLSVDHLALSTVGIWYSLRISIWKVT